MQLQCCNEDLWLTLGKGERRGEGGGRARWERQHTSMDHKPHHFGQSGCANLGRICTARDTVMRTHAKQSEIHSRHLQSKPQQTRRRGTDIAQPVKGNKLPITTTAINNSTTWPLITSYGHLKRKHFEVKTRAIDPCHPKVWWNAGSGATKVLNDRLSGIRSSFQAGEQPDVPTL